METPGSRRAELPTALSQPNNTTYSTGFQNYLVNAIDGDTYANEPARLDINLTNRNKLSASMQSR